MADQQSTEPDEPPVAALVDEKDKQNLTTEPEPSSASTENSPPPSASTTTHPPTTSPLSPHTPRKTSGKSVEEYYTNRPRFDKLGNKLPDRTHGAMSSVYGKSKISLPGDLGPNDPRRPKSPAPANMPGDLGPNDPRRPRSTNSSPVPSSHSRKASDPEGMLTEEGERIMKDPKQPKQEEEKSKDSDVDGDTDNEGVKRGRGRIRPEPGRTTSGKAINVRSDSEDSVRQTKPDPTKGESLLTWKGDPKIKVTPPSEKKRVHPSTSFDFAPSSTGTPLDSDEESHSELRAAQKLSLTTSAIHSTPSAHRALRQIIRGDYAHFQREAEEGRKRQRMYLVATDISPEAEYALEWTIGTVLRDGDTLFAVYAVDEENVGGEGGVEVGHGAESVRDTAAIIRGLPATNAPPPSPGPSPLSRSAVGSINDNRSRSRGPAGTSQSHAEAERRKAIEAVTERCIRLLRKTRLQVRVVVEVFHCKSPRHMITEVIDFLSPTLVVIGSRGRNSVKGVLLGSFSNYLVTKSSVPVMVARKKLRKHSKTDKRNRDGTSVPYTGTGRTGRFSNVIEAPRGKGLRVDSWDKVGID
ncbi:hypothetical protein MBLNU230_g4363t1 [Neophaeotheca triangularis]